MTNIDDTIKKMEENLAKKKKEKAASTKYKIGILQKRVDSYIKQRDLLNDSIDDLAKQINILVGSIKKND